MNPMQHFLRLLSRLYGFAVAVRLTLYRTGYRHSKKLQRFTISIGNLTTGGTGKTPLVEFTARFLLSQGHRVAILTRGYRRARPWQQIVINARAAELPDVRLVGDEPIMLARHLDDATIVVNRDRYAAGTWAEAHADSDVHILDDGYQHLALDRDLNFLVIDAERPFDSGELLPLGRLREPPGEVRRASAVILTRTDRPFDQYRLEGQIRHLAESPDLPIFYAYHDLTALLSAERNMEVPPVRFRDRRVAMLCAIGRPDLFLADLSHYGMQIVHSLALRDHGRYTPGRLTKFFAEAEKQGAEAVITTEKDWTKLSGTARPEKPALWIARLEARIFDEATFKSFVLRSMLLPAVSPREGFRGPS